MEQMIIFPTLIEKFPLVNIDKLPDNKWNMLNEAMFNGDWETVNAIMQPRQDVAEQEK